MVLIKNILLQSQDGIDQHFLLQDAEGILFNSIFSLAFLHLETIFQNFNLLPLAPVYICDDDRKNYRFSY
jgi:hypothetical protein